MSIKLRTLIIFSVIVFAASPVFPITPPKLPPILPPQIQPPPAPAHPLLTGTPVQLTPELIRTSGLSGTVQADLLNILATAQATSTDSITAQSVPASDRIRGRNHRLVLAPNTSSGGAVAAMTDSNSDIEPAVITNRFVENGNTVDRTTIAFTKYDSNSAPQQYWASTTNDSTFTTGMFSPQYPDTRTSDPMLAENPYVSAGYFPKRTYVTGTSYNTDGHDR